MRVATLLSSAALIAASAATASAQVVYNGGLWNQNEAYWVNMDFSVAQPFAPTAATTFNTIRFFYWEMTGAGPTASPFQYSIYDGAAFAPGNTYVNGSSSVTTTLVGTAGPFDVFQADISVSSTTLNAGNYFLQLTSTEPSNDISWSETSANVDPVATQQYQGTFFEHTNAPLAMQLLETEATPEPASLVLLGTGLIGIVAVGRRRLGRSD